VEIGAEIADIKETQKEHSKILLRLESVIVDDPGTNRIGYGSRIKLLETYVNSDKKAKWYIAGFIAALAIGIKELLAKIF